MHTARHERITPSKQHIADFDVTILHPQHWFSCGIIHSFENNLWNGLEILREHDISGKELVKFMNDSVAARLNNAAFWSGLDRLRDDHGIDGKQFVKFMSGSVAARLNDAAFWSDLDRLRDDHGIGGKKLVTFMNDSVAARLGDASFWQGLLTLGSYFVAPRLVPLMCCGLAYRLNPVYASQILAIARHLDSYGLDGVGSLISLLPGSPLPSRIPEFCTHVLALDGREELDAFLGHFRGTYAQKTRAMQALGISAMHVT